MKFRGGWLGPKTGSHAAELDPTSNATSTAIDSERSPSVKGTPSVGEKMQGPPHEDSSTESDVEQHKSLQYGVQVAEATLKVWTRKHLIAAYIL